MVLGSCIDAQTGASIVALLNVAAAACGTVLAAVALVLEKRWGARLISASSIGWSLATAVLLGTPTAGLFWLAPAGSQVGCIGAVINSLGPLPLSLVALICAAALLAREAVLQLWWRWRLGRLVVAAVAAAAPVLPPGEPLRLLVPQAAGGLLLAPLLHGLRLLCDRGSEPSLLQRRVQVTVADPPPSDEGLKQAGQQAGLDAPGGACAHVDVAAVSADFSGAPLADSPAFSAAVLPYGAWAATLQEAPASAREATRDALLRTCAQSLTPDGVVVIGAQAGDDARLWREALGDAGFELVELPAALRGCCAAAELVVGRAPAILPPLALLPPLPSLSVRRPAPLPWFPPGPHWRARNAAIALTALADLLCAALVIAFFDPWLLVPQSATWITSVGALLISAVLFAPLVVVATAQRLTTFAAGDAPPAAYADRGCTTQAGRLQGGDLEIGSRLLDGTAAEESPGTGSERIVTASAVLRRWLLLELPLHLASLFGVQMLFWAALFGVELLSDRAGLDPDTSTAVSFGLVFGGPVVVWALWAVCRRQRRPARRDAGEGVGPVNWGVGPVN